ncbi:MAG: amine oxidase [Planctomycetota bacterium]|nr:MAG: amine oxidase [Planctomycetota bacterium]
MMGRLLAADGHDVKVFEAGSEIGGLCRSRVVDGYTFDLAGGHIMFTRNQRVSDFWTELFADDPAVETERCTRILHRKDHFVSYPFENALGELPLEHNLECTEASLQSYLRRRAGDPEPDNFHDWIRWKMGAGIAEHFMDPYNRKIWKSDLREMGCSWIAGRVPDAPLEDVLTASLGRTTDGYTHQSHFRYPRTGGFAAIHERIARPIVARIETNHPVQNIERAPDGGWLVDGERFDHVISTVPLHVLPRLMPAMDAGAAAAASALQWRGVAGYLFGIEAEFVRPFSWVYLPHADQGPTNRITYLSNYSPENAPSGKGSIMAEVTYNPATPPGIDDAGRMEVAKGLEQAGLLDASRLEVTDAHLNPVSYILYDLDFESKRNTVLAWTDAQEGLHCIGRFGRYEYHNSDQVLARCFELHDKLAPVLARGGGPLADPADG